MNAIDNSLMGNVNFPLVLLCKSIYEISSIDSLVIAWKRSLKRYIRRPRV